MASQRLTLRQVAKLQAILGYFAHQVLDFAQVTPKGVNIRVYPDYSMDGDGLSPGGGA